MSDAAAEGGVKKEMQWMYGDAGSSILDRDKYLTGSKIDKNFELYGADGKKEAFGNIESLISRAAETHNRPKAGSSALDLETVRKEDPLVAIKLQEEKVKRDVLNNPVKMKKLQKMVMSAMEKKMKSALKDEYKEYKKQVKKQKKKERKEARKSSRRSRSRSRSEEHDRDRHSRRRSRTPERRGHRDRDSRSERERRRRSSSGQRVRRSRTQSPKPQSSAKRTERRHSPPSAQKGTSRRSSEAEVPFKRMKGAALPPSSATATRSRRSPSPTRSDSDEERRKVAYERSYGLVKMRQDSSSDADSPPARSTQRPSTSGDKTDEPAKLTTSNYYRFYKKAGEVRPGAADQTSSSDRRRSKPMSSEEKAAKLAEMTDNAKWREEQRDRNLKMFENIERAEKEADERGKKKEGADFIRPMLSNATETGTMEERLKRKKGKLQRGHDAMDRSFTKR